MVENCYTHGHLATTSYIKNIVKGKEVIAVALDEGPALSDLVSFRSFQYTRHTHHITLTGPSLLLEVFKLNCILCVLAGGLQDIPDGCVCSDAFLCWRLQLPQACAGGSSLWSYLLLCVHFLHSIYFSCK